MRRRVRGLRRSDERLLRALHILDGRERVVARGGGGSRR